MLNSPAEDYPKHAVIDASGRKLLDKQGHPTTYGAPPRYWKNARRAAPPISRSCHKSWLTVASIR
jgi:hypothetical protein